MTLHFEEKILTPDLAQQLLEGNHGNRKLDNSKVSQWAAEISAGRWRMTNETIAIAEDGRVVDGQHRLHAVVKARMPIPVVICWGADPDTFGLINVGKMRTGNDIWYIAGHKTTNAAAIAKLVYLYEKHRTDADWHNRGRVGADLILSWCKDNQYMDLIKRASYREREFGKQIKGVGSCIGASLALAEIHGGAICSVQNTYDTVYIPVVTALGLKEGMPAYVLNRILNKRDSRAGKESGNPFRKGESRTNIHRSRLAILLRVVADTYGKVERVMYPFDSPMPDMASLMKVANLC
jgi:hypothetical protein